MKIIPLAITTNMAIWSVGVHKPATFVGMAKRYCPKLVICRTPVSEDLPDGLVDFSLGHFDTEAFFLIGEF